MSTREERDSMGAVLVPEEAYYGAQTQRAVENFRISNLRMPVALIRALGLVKKHAARANARLGALAPEIATAVAQAAQEVAQGLLDDQFVLDVFQTGSGTSTNMNANEVIAGRANEILTGKRGGRSPVHPNDHVNRGQSSNDVIPTAIHLAAFERIRSELQPGLRGLQKNLEAKAGSFRGIRKIGRTHLQDAVPLGMDQVFGGFARQAALGLERLSGAEPRLAELPLGGTAVGTGVNTHPDFAHWVIEGLAAETGCPFREARDHFEAQAARDALVETSGALKTVAVSLHKIANDIRWLASGPRCGLGELQIPALQPGSSIMPGKVNPVVPEAVIQVAAQVVGNDAAITLGGLGGHFELNVMMPLMAHNLLQSIEILSTATRTLNEKCVQGLEVDAARCESFLEQSLSLATALVPHLGYDRAAALAKEAFETGRTVREVALEKDLLPEETLNRVLDEMVRGAIAP